MVAALATLAVLIFSAEANAFGRKRGCGYGGGCGYGCAPTLAPMYVRPPPPMPVCAPMAYGGCCGKRGLFGGLFRKRRCCGGGYGGCGYGGCGRAGCGYGGYSYGPPPAAAGPAYATPAAAPGYAAPGYAAPRNMVRNGR
jgi:hypothetical protein